MESTIAPDDEIPAPVLETRQRHGEAAIPPWTEQWSQRRQLGFGLVAIIPAVLLTATFAMWLLSTLGVGLPATRQLLPLLFYTHVGAEFITLLIFGHLMIANPNLGGVTKLVWAVAFLTLAPFAIPAFWAVHVWHEEPSLPSEGAARPARTIRVYDYDYDTHAEGIERRADGSIHERVDAS